MIRLGFIIPVKYLYLYEFRKQSDYHLVLAHMVRDSSAYRDFYRKCAEDGDFITLDNSSYELGDNVFSEEELVEFARAVKASEIMAPEEYLNHELTCEKVESFLDQIKTIDDRMNVFGTVHGSSYENYLKCIHRFSELGVDTIGLSCRLSELPLEWTHIHCNYSKEWVRSSVRMNLAVELSKRFYGYRKPIPRVHLLGLNHPCELAFQRKWPFIRSNDSSAAYLSGIQLQSVTSFKYQKPITKLDFYDERSLLSEERECILNNIRELKTISGY